MLEQFLHTLGSRGPLSAWHNNNSNNKKLFLHTGSIRIWWEGKLNSIAVHNQFHDAKETNKKINCEKYKWSHHSSSLISESVILCSQSITFTLVASSNKKLRDKTKASYAWHGAKLRLQFYSTSLMHLLLLLFLNASASCTHIQIANQAVKVTSASTN